ncbi:MAG TPA: hypothetical protein VJT78_04275 [Candidatus Dormibacteraeota bacterium]|nr:hypothetical protein [Candidatus Dormibacteraeota bacterium]
MKLRWLVAVAIVLGLLALVSVAATTGQVIVANVDGPPVLVDVAGMPRVGVECPGTQTINVPLLRVVARTVVVTNARDGSVLKRISINWDTAIVIRRDGVNYGVPGSSYGPAPVKGCA